MTKETHSIIKAVAKLCFVLLIVGVTLRALVAILMLSIPLIFWGVVLLGVYGLFLLVVEKEEKDINK